MLLRIKWKFLIILYAFEYNSNLLFLPFMKAFTILALILLILSLTFVLPNTINEYKLSRSRETVTVKII